MRMFGKMIRERRLKLGLTQDQVCAQAGIAKPYLSNIETGKARPPSDRVIRDLAAALDFEPAALCHLAHLERMPPDVRLEMERLRKALEQLRSGRRIVPVEGDAELDDLLGQKAAAGEGVGEMLSAGSMVPVINSVAAGYPHNFTDLDYPPSVAQEYVRCPDVTDPNAFGARVVGDSMSPKYVEGDIVVFTPNTQPHNGADCFIRFTETNDTTFKRFYQDEDGLIRLQPLNSAYPSKRYKGEEINGLYPALYRIEKIR